MATQANFNSDGFERTLVAQWADMDFNSHMRNTAYLDKCVDMRLMFFASCGFPLTEFARMKVGPLAMKDDLEYRREVHLHDEIRATMVLRGLAGDGSRIVWRNDFYRRDVLATRVHTLSAWLDLTQRKLVAPPAGVVEALRALPHTDDFQVLPTLGEK